MTDQLDNKVNSIENFKEKETGNENENENENEHDIRPLIDAIWRKFGYDFSGYAEASFKRRIKAAISKYECQNLSGILQKILNEPDFFPILLNDLTVTVTEMFRDPQVYKAIREHVFPYLRTYPKF